MHGAIPSLTQPEVYKTDTEDKMHWKIQKRQFCMCVNILLLVHGAQNCNIKKSIRKKEDNFTENN